MTFRAGIVLACLGLTALAVVWLRTEKRRAKSAALRLEIRKFELENDRWRLGREVAQRTNPAELRARAAAMGIAIPEDVPPASGKADPRGAASPNAAKRRTTPGPASTPPPNPPTAKRPSATTAAVTPASPPGSGTGAFRRPALDID